MESFLAEFYHHLNSTNSLKIHFGSRTYMCDEIKESILKYAEFLFAEGVRQGTRVVLLSENRPEAIFAIFGIMSVGAVPVILDRTLPQEVLFQLTAPEPYVLTDREEPYPASRVIYFEMVEQAIAANSIQASSDLRAALPLEGAAGGTIIILQSSGTTGLPKKVLYGDNNLLWVAREYHRVYRLHENYVIAHMLPTHYSLGLITCDLVAMLYQKEIVILPTDDLDAILRGIGQFRIQILPTFPLLYKKMIKKNLDDYDFSSLRICDSGGELLPLPIIKKLEEHTGLIITEGYGLTETSSLSHFLLPDELGELRLGSVGQPCTGVMCKIVNEVELEVDFYETGELWLKGPLLMQGYDDLALNERAFSPDGWFKTGDIFYRDPDNYYYFTVRKADIGSSRLHMAKPLRELEQALYAIDLIQEVASYVQADEQVMLFVKPAQSSRELLDSLRREIEAALLHVALLISAIRFVDQIPRTSSGKIQRRQEKP